MRKEKKIQKLEEIKMDTLSKDLTLLAVVSTLTGISMGYSLGYITAPRIPEAKQSELESGYVNPSKLKIKLEDLDYNGKKEVQMKYDGKSYMLKLNEQGKPTVVSYDLKPTEIIPK